MALGTVISGITGAAGQNNWLGDVVNTGLGRNIGNRTLSDNKVKQGIANVLDIGGNFSGLFSAFKKSDGDMGGASNAISDYNATSATYVATGGEQQRILWGESVIASKKADILDPIISTVTTLGSNIPSYADETSSITSKLTEIIDFVKNASYTIPQTADLSNVGAEDKFSIGDSNFNSLLDEKKSDLYSLVGQAGQKYNAEVKSTIERAQSAYEKSLFGNEYYTTSPTTSTRSVATGSLGVIFVILLIVYYLKRKKVLK